ncbi:MAG: hypothetical protein VYD87_14155 [Pseudomonadota bacterium]|nr:hypothetical protein [Pseudomonadota bacterium]MEE3098171.1 hypothetical protein [Pseudomonadota bacterium]
MALLHVTARAGGLLVRDACGRDADLARALGRVPRGAPVVILLHGYRYRPGDPARDPHAQLYGGVDPDPEIRARGALADWPAALGFSRDLRGDGLCLGFGWDACEPHGASLAREARNGFASVYARAAGAGAALAALIGCIGAARPDLRVDLFAHSLGARVALAAIAARMVRGRVGRAILLGAAEDAGVAARAMAAGQGERRGRGLAVYHFAARHNDAFDLLFEAAAPRIEGRRPQALGRAGPAPGVGAAAGGARADWIDLQLDSAAFHAWAARRGAPLAPSSRRVCHWSFYTRPGAMELYRAILRDRGAWSIPAMRAAGAPEGLEARWSGLAPLRAPRMDPRTEGRTEARPDARAPRRRGRWLPAALRALAWSGMRTGPGPEGGAAA